ncbi:MAG: EscU/YscU/HrcU family type III secretion system export apparatus switch protein [Alphaproteobacteria bacterium]|jgi:flagellar biosynthesis protein|nr:EscU/YscU/HrcU family type III secretion system export apparatus switch protein [Alphaproteobacteria bacterium]
MSDEKKTDPPKNLSAIALEYEKEAEGAPKVVAKGKGNIAQRILEIAEEHDIHIHRDADLMTVLEAVELNHEIPLEVYAVVAEIFAYIYRMNNEKKNA